MNLVRNHIFYYKKKILDLCGEGGFAILEEYYLPTPPEVANGFMADMGLESRVKRLKRYSIALTEKKTVHPWQGRGGKKLRRMELDKNILEEYTHACILLKETEKEIQELERKKIPAILGKVKGSNPEFPYQACSFTISGSLFDDEDKKELQKQRQILEERKARARKVKLRVEEWMNMMPIRMQRIVKYKFLEGMTWEETAAKISGRATGDSVKKEFQRFLKKK